MEGPPWTLSMQTSVYLGVCFATAKIRAQSRHVLGQRGGFKGVVAHTAKKWPIFGYSLSLGTVQGSSTKQFSMHATESALRITRRSKNAHHDLLLNTRRCPGSATTTCTRPSRGRQCAACSSDLMVLASFLFTPHI